MSPYSTVQLFSATVQVEIKMHVVKDVAPVKAIIYMTVHIQIGITL